MKSLKIPRAVDLVLIIGAVCCLVTAYSIHSQYIRAHRAAGKAHEQARIQAAGDSAKYYSLLQDERGLSPETYYRRAKMVARWTLWLFCGAAVCGLAAHRWAAPAVTLAIWLVAVALTGTRI
jgi:hypothetical protein